MGRQTRREKRKESKRQEHEEEKLYINLDEGKEMIKLVQTLGFYIMSKINIDSKHALEILHYAIGPKASKICLSYFITEIQLKGAKAYQTFVDEMIEESFKKGFETMFTYVQFLKLTCIEKDGVMHILSEDEQRHAKRWVHMKRTFDNFVTFFNVDMATPESTHLWKISKT